MDRLVSRYDPEEEVSHQRRAHNEALLDDLRSRLNLVKEGGGARAVERHRSRGKLLPRERIERIIDPGSPFLEIGSLAGWGLYEGGCAFRWDRRWHREGSQPAVCLRRQ